MIHVHIKERLMVGRVVVENVIVTRKGTYGFVRFTTVRKTGISTHVFLLLQIFIVAGMSICVLRVHPDKSGMAKTASPVRPGELQHPLVHAPTAPLVKNL